MNSILRTRSLQRCCRALLTGACWLGALAAYAEPATIELVDGSTLRGEVRSLKGGAYEVETQSLGVIRIPQNDVALVSYRSASDQANAPSPGHSSAAGAAPSTAALAEVQRRLTANPATLSMIMGLTDDAQIQAVIRDPAIQAAISSGDFQGLMRNPKIKALMEHPTIKQISSQAK